MSKVDRIVTEQDELPIVDTEVFRPTVYEDHTWDSSFEQTFNGDASAGLRAEWNKYLDAGDEERDRIYYRWGEKAEVQ